MSFPIVAFQVFNLNDYGVKLFSNLEENQLYLAKFNVLKKDSDPNDVDEGSSQRNDKIFLSNEGAHNTLKHFPFTALFKSELSLVKVKDSALSSYIALYNEEYNYILIFYPDSNETTQNLEAYLTNLNVQIVEAQSFEKFIEQKYDELDAKLFKESLGQQRLRKKVNPKLTKKTMILDQHIKIIEDDEKYSELYGQLIREFDLEFLHSKKDRFEYNSSTTQKNI